MSRTVEKANGESGNVLFLILIAVALFAALSYAVTQSSRSGGSDAAGETNLLNSAQITQYPASIRTSILRMIIGGTDVAELEFNSPADFGAAGFVVRDGVFHPSGGGATFADPPPDLIANNTGGNGVWYFNTNFEINLIGLSGTDGADLVAFLPGVTQAICRRINDQLGLPVPPPVVSTDISTDFRTRIQGATSTAIPLATFTATAANNAATLPAAFDGQPFGCFENGGTAGLFVYYHVLVER